MTLREMIYERILILHESNWNRIKWITDAPISPLPDLSLLSDEELLTLYEREVGSDAQPMC